MGDPRRFDVVASFIGRNFPVQRYPCVADVAGGKGDLKRLLIEKGYKSKTFDSRWGKHGYFFRRMAEEWNLIVGLHPDGATEEIAHSALTTPVVLIPCCHLGWNGPESHGSPSMTETVRRLWRRLRVPYRETLLNMSGKNVVLWTERKRQ